MNPDAAKHLQSAFPHMDQAWNMEQQRFDQLASAGMSLRDYFAGQALGEVIVALNMSKEIGAGQLPDMAAKYAYRIADAMLAERTK